MFIYEVLSSLNNDKEGKISKTKQPTQQQQQRQ